MNGTRARVVRGLSGGQGGQPQPELVMRAHDRRLQNLVNTGGDLLRAPSDNPLKEDRREFMLQVIQLLDTHRMAGDYDGLALFASPALQDELCSQMPPRLLGTIVACVPMPLVDLPGEMLARAAAARLAEDNGIGKRSMGKVSSERSF